MNRVRVVRALRVAVACAVLLSFMTVPAFAEGLEPTVAAGVVIGATDLSGMTATQARAAIEQAVLAAAGRRVVVKAAGRSFSFQPAASLRLDVAGMLATALAARPDVAVPPTGVSAVATISVPASYTISPVALNAFLASVRRQTYVAPRNAVPYVTRGRIAVRPSRYGKTLDVSRTRRLILTQLAPRSAFATRTVVTAPFISLRPKVLTSQVGKTILVDRSARTLKLFNGSRLVRAYRVAVGMPAYPTPLGRWKVVSRQYRPAWYNPGSSWAYGMPRYIPPGPGNPLGTRALALSASGILIHGTSKDWSIGRAASHGCMRMHRWDIENLYPQVPVGTRVWIVP
jgi:lipoprotein-anchoring transpeptidase ErfK/SrfK